MSLSNQFIKVIAAIFLVFSLSSSATDIKVDDTITDELGDASGGSKYEIQGMDVYWGSDDKIVVSVYTNFANYNNRVGVGGNGNKIVFGDLLLGTAGNVGTYDYAFRLTDGRFDDYMSTQALNWVGSSDNVGGLYSISGTQSSKDYHGLTSTTLNGAVMGIASGGVLNTGNWTVDTQRMSAGFDTVSFMFDVSGIAAFQNSTQLALSWAMSCFNDNVTGSVSVLITKSVPEPQTLLLFILAIAAMTFRHKKQSSTNHLLKA